MVMYAYPNGIMCAGYETAKAIINMQGTVVMACRSPDRASAAKVKLIQETGCADAKVQYIPTWFCIQAVILIF